MIILQYISNPNILYESVLPELLFFVLCCVTFLFGLLLFFFSIMVISFQDKDTISSIHYIAVCVDRASIQFQTCSHSICGDRTCIQFPNSVLTPFVPTGQAYTISNLYSSSLSVDRSSIQFQTLLKQFRTSVHPFCRQDKHTISNICSYAICLDRTNIQSMCFMFYLIV